MRLRSLLWAAPVAGAAACGLAADRLLSAAATNPTGDPTPATALPVARVVLFSSGVGYFAREGTVEGDARVDLVFPERDVNDLIKSMTLRDLDGGRVAAVAYDSREPVARTLASFAVNLNNQPTLAQILTQARGEKVEVALQPTAQAQPGVLAGIVVGVERQKLPSGPNQTVECDVLNLLTADGLRAVKLTDVLRVKFTNPALEADLRRALDVLALSHDAQKKAVSVAFAGEGKRRVQVGYVSEAPVWKTTYRLALAEDGKPQLQGWAVVENTTDDDWQGVKMALVGGRPVSFRMDLYDPLYVPRPLVEPELFASLRPPAYHGGYTNGEALAGDLGDNMPAAKRAAAGREDAARKAGAVGGFGAGGAVDRLSESRQLGLRVEQEQLEQRRAYAANLGKELAERMTFASVQAAATASRLGDTFQYVVDHPVSLPRQKSALLPVLTGAEVGAERVSIYNPAVQARHPLLGVWFTNTTGTSLAQGPVTVFDGSTYAGDARLLDLQKGEKRLLAFAIDLGTEVTPEAGPGTTRVTEVRAQKGIVVATNRQVEEKRYKVVNRSDKDRALVIEHSNRTTQQFKLIDTPRPAEETPELWRFQTKVPAGKTETFTVKEERVFPTTYQLTNSPDDTIRYVISLNETSPALKAKLQEALTLKGKWDAQRRDLAQIQADLTRLNADQDRVRKNLRETPRDIPLFKTYTDKLEAQEKEIDALTENQKQTTTAEVEAKKSYETFLAGITD